MFLASSFEIEVMCVPWIYIRYTHMQSRTCMKPSELRTEENTETAMDLRKEKSIQCLQSEIQLPVGGQTPPSTTIHVPLLSIGYSTFLP